MFLILFSFMHYKRKSLSHAIPHWVADGAEYFITVCTVPRGRNQLCHLNTWSLIKESILFRQDRGDWWICLLLLMPDHLHAIMSFSPEIGMKDTMNHWKRYTCKNGNIQWQRDFFDHRLRANESYMEKAHYIRMNPVRAGLIERPEDWRYIWENRT